METLDGITVLAYPQWSLGLFADGLYQQCDAHVYHSQEPSIGTWVGMRAMPGRSHAVTCQDPRNGADWWTEFVYESPRRKLYFPVSYLFENSVLSKRAVRKADAVYCQAKFVRSKAKRLYGLDEIPGFLPNPVRLPTRPLTKAKEPTVCFVARWDRRKRPEVFLDLASQFPSVRFIAVGASEDVKWDANLRNRYRGVPNLDMVGFVDQFSDVSLESILEESWVLVNTAARECLPVSFLEAAAYGCAIVSCNDPDGFASEFGYHATQDDFAEGLEHLLTADTWREKGALGQEYVRETHELSRVIDRHLEAYGCLLGRASD
jgi:glycosyltransferase involved in cell wall biosynthesis